MATVTIAKNQRTIGVHQNQNSKAGNHQDTGFLSHFASAAQVWADKYTDYKYNETDWRAISP